MCCVPPSLYTGATALYICTKTGQGRAGGCAHACVGYSYLVRHSSGCRDLGRERVCGSVGWNTARSTSWGWVRGQDLLTVKSGQQRNRRGWCLAGTSPQLGKKKTTVLTQDPFIHREYPYQRHPGRA